MPAVNKETLEVVRNVTDRTEFGAVTLTRRNVRLIGFQFFKGSEAVELANGSTGTLVLKKKGEYEDPALVLVGSWTKSGEGATAVYYFELDLRQDPVEELFDEDDGPITGLILELNFIEGGRPQTPVVMDAIINNRYFQPDEILPDPTAPDYPDAINILVKTAQTLTTGEKLQVRTNIAAAPLDSPALTGVPTVPTASLGTNTTQAASTAFVAAAITALLNGAPGAMDTLDELAAALGDDSNFATTVTNALAAKQAKAWLIKTTTYTAAAGERMLADTSSAAFTITLPASPTAGDCVEIGDAQNTWGTNNLTIGRNSSKIEGLTEDLVCNLSGELIRLVYQGSAFGWRIF